MFAIGDMVWHARYTRAVIVQVPCPVCFGKLAVTLTLGNGDEMQLQCGYCSKGYMAPRGTVDDWQPVASAVRLMVDSVTVSTTGVEYGAECTTMRAADVFATEAEALVRAKEIADAARDDQTKRADYMKHDNKKSYAWNAGYHMTEARDLRKRADRHEAMAKLCKAVEP